MLFVAIAWSGGGMVALKVGILKRYRIFGA
jgi:hypothetical protein